MAPTLEQAVQHLERGNLAAAETVAQTLLTARPDSTEARYILGLVRLQQKRPEEAAELLGRLVTQMPGQPPLLQYYAAALSQLGRHDEAGAALGEAVRLAPQMSDAWFELGKQQHVLGRHVEAEHSYRTSLNLVPQQGFVTLALGSLLLETGRNGEAETVLAGGLTISRGDLAVMLGQQLIAAQRRQGKKQAALQSVARLRKLAPELADELDELQARLLDEMHRFDEALTVLEAALRRSPLHAGLHDTYNDLLYRLGRESDFLTSYDRAPAAVSLRLAKASFLRHARRPAEAHEIYAALLMREPGNVEAIQGQADVLSEMGQHGEAIRLLEDALPRHPGDGRLDLALATAALRGRDPEKSAAMATRSLAATPGDHLALALLGSAWRLMGDARDETLNGYDSLVRVFDLEVPEGFSSMGDFNTQMAALLAQQHPATREFLSQSLRGGTQSGNLFESGDERVNRLRTRLSEAVGRYIEKMAVDSRHPLLSRRQNGFSYAGSWSSRLSDCGYHVNHIHPQGWISCCYYVGVPDAAADAEQKQGWIKFGEPPFDVGLKQRRAVQPVPGRLVLFPSYMWHGTNPFRSEAVRTTIAFDVVPSVGTGEVPLVTPLLQRSR